MKLPCIDSINTYIIDVPGLYSDDTIPDAARFSPVTRLRLTWKDMSISSLALLVNAPVGLTHLAYLGVGDTQLRVVEFMGNIAPLRLSLQHLKLDYFRVQVALNSLKEDRLRSSLRTWPVLQTLSCSVTELVGNVFAEELLCLPDVLPRSLRAFRVLEDKHILYQSLVDMVVDQLLRRKEDALPALETLCLKSWSNEGDDEQANEVLGVACVNAGVEIEERDCLWW